MKTARQCAIAKQDQKSYIKKISLTNRPKASREHSYLKGEKPILFLFRKTPSLDSKRRKLTSAKKYSIHIHKTKKDSLKKEEGSCPVPNSAFFSSALRESDDERTKARRSCHYLYARKTVVFYLFLFALPRGLTGPWAQLNKARIHILHLKKRLKKARP